MNKLYLAIDQGGHASRAMVFDGDGGIAAQAFREIAATPTGRDRFEYDADALLRSVQGAIAEVLDRLRGGRRAVVGAGLATQRSNVVCWDRISGAALSPVISWQDRRASRWLARLRGHEGAIRRITGLPLSAHYGANKLRWCLRNLPAVRSAHRSGRLAWGPMASYLAFHLLQERPVVIDPVHASRTALWDINGGAWSETMLDLFGLSGDALPAVVPCRHAFGSLDRGGHAIPMTVMTGDQSAALYAHGAPRRGWLYLTTGTGAFVQKITGQRRPRPTRLLNSIVFHDGRRPTFALEGTINGAGSALAWLAERHRATFGFEQLAHWLDTVTDPPLFLNGVSGLGTPFLVPDAPIRFLGRGGIPEQAVAVIESIVFLIEANVETMTGTRPRPLGLHVGGGLARLDGFCQRLADLSGLSVHRCRATETTAHGLARLLINAEPVEPAAADGDLCEHDAFDPRHNVPLVRHYRRWNTAIRQALRGRARAE